jgi:hypothetical protein
MAFVRVKDDEDGLPSKLGGTTSNTSSRVWDEVIFLLIFIGAGDYLCRTVLKN